MKPMLFSNLELHLTTTRSSTFSGFKLALMGVTTLPATEKTRSNLDEVAGTGKTLLTSLARRGTESRDASPITAGPLWTAHQATVGKTSFFTPWGTLNFFSSSYSSSFTISLLFCACRWFLKALVEPWQTLMTKAEPAMMNIYQQEMTCGRHLWLGCTCTEDTLQWRHQDCLPSISKLWMPVFSEQRCCFGRGAWLSVEEVNM